MVDGLREYGCMKEFQIDITRDHPQRWTHENLVLLTITSRTLYRNNIKRGRYGAFRLQAWCICTLEELHCEHVSTKSVF